MSIKYRLALAPKTVPTFYHMPTNHKLSIHRLYDEWSESLLSLVASVEASVDFSDDVENVDEAKIMVKVKDFVGMIEQHMNDSNAGERLRNGVRVSIIGKPNVGKSTLLNALCRRSAAIVSPVPGTTRDMIEQHLDIEGYPVNLIDTAGIRNIEEADSIEVEGMKRTNEAAYSSDLLICIKSAEEIELESLNKSNITVNEELGISVDKSIILYVINKSDLLSEESYSRISRTIQVNSNVCLMSCSTREGFEEFTELLGNNVKKICTRDEGNKMI